MAAYTTIDDSGLFFNTKLYTGTGSSNAVTGVGFQPDWVWFKNRAATTHNTLFDAVRGANKVIYANLTAQQYTVTQELKSFDSDGFTVGTETAENGNGNAIASWNWKANGSGSSNTDGSINTIKTSASTTSGFSISTYTGTGSNATIGHGLGVAPKVVIYKRTDAANNWFMYNENIGNTKYLNLDTAGAEATYNVFQNTNPSSTLLYVSGDSGANASSGTYVAYCFAEKQGYSKFGSYKGNGNNNGTFTYLGFKPAFLIIRRTDTGNSWYVYTGKASTSGGNLTDRYLEANEALVEATTTGEYGFDFLSNGFKATGTGGGTNDGSGTYIYMAFAESPFVSSTGIPTTAR